MLEMAVAVVSGFAVCWLPFSIIMLFSFYKWDQTTKSSCGVQHLLTVVTIMARANGPFAVYDHMVQKPPCWRANRPLGHPKQSNLT